MRNIDMCHPQNLSSSYRKTFRIRYRCGRSDPKKRLYGRLHIVVFLPYMYIYIYMNMHIHIYIYTLYHITIYVYKCLWYCVVCICLCTYLDWESKFDPQRLVSLWKNSNRLQWVCFPSSARPVPPQLDKIKMYNPKPQTQKPDIGPTKQCYKSRLSRCYMLGQVSLPMCE